MNEVKVEKFSGQSKNKVAFDKSKENHIPNGLSGRSSTPTIYGPDLTVTVNNKNIRAASEDVPPRTVEVIDYNTIPLKARMQTIEREHWANGKNQLLKYQSQSDKFDEQQERQRKESLNKSKLNNLKKTKEIEKIITNELEQVDQRFMTENEQKRREQFEKKKNLIQKNLQIESINNANLITKFVEKFKQAKAVLINRFNTKDKNQLLQKMFIGKLIELTQSYDQLKKLCTITDVKDEVIGVNATDVVAAEKCFRGIENLIDAFDIEYDKLVQKIAENNEKLQQQKMQEQQAAAHQKLLDEQKANEEVEHSKVQSRNVSIDPNSSLLTFVSNECYEFYVGLQMLLQKFSAEIEPLLNDESLKKYRFDCQKAINIPVNAISAVNSQHLIDKYDKLSALLSGNAVKVGDNMVSASSHPLGKQFCMFLMAKKFVHQADTQISSNPKAAFPVAAVLVALWQKFPEFGLLFLAHLHRECPYMVPYFVPQIQGQSTEDYLKSVGFHYVDGVLENNDLYLKRLSGIIRLYSAVLITKPRREFLQLEHPHNLNHGWKWLTNLLNLDPLPDICATLILEFLQTTGSYFITNYGKQFIKLLKFIHEKYFIKLNKIDEGGPKARLEGFLMKIFKDGNIQPPDGILSDGFW